MARLECLMQGIALSLAPDAAVVLFRPVLALSIPLFNLVLLMVIVVMVTKQQQQGRRKKKKTPRRW